jgi:hypothetical protein
MTVSNILDHTLLGEQPSVRYDWESRLGDRALGIDPLAVPALSLTWIPPMS